jgi:hypothetical protein
LDAPVHREALAVDRTPGGDNIPVRVDGTVGLSLVSVVLREEPVSGPGTVRINRRGVTSTGYVSHPQVAIKRPNISESAAGGESRRLPHGC